MPSRQPGPTPGDPAGGEVSGAVGGSNVADDATAASVRRLGSLERQVEHLSVVVARLDDSVTALDGTVGDQLPRLHHEVVAASAMIDAVAAQVAADTDALSRRLEGIEPRSRRPWWRRLFRREA